MRLRIVGWMMLVAGAVAGQPPPNADPPPTGGVPDPPAAQVRIQVRALPAVAPGKDIAYKLIVTNPSAATAFNVVVRNPLPDRTTVVKADPTPEQPPAAVRPGLTWKLGTLSAGQSKTIDLVLRPGPDVNEVRNQAFVSFEYGQSVLTRIERAKLIVSKKAPKSAVAGEPIAVQVVIVNPGPVAVPDVKLVETISPAFEFAPGNEGERGTSDQQRVWKLGTLGPNQRRELVYRVTTKTGTKLLTTSAVTGHGVAAEPPPQTETDILAPALAVELTGPPSVVAGEVATYSLVVRNTGTMPLGDVRVTGAFDDQCKLKGMTDGGQRYRDRVVWQIPRLASGEAKSFTLKLDSPTTGRRAVRASATAPRGVEATAREVQTSFQGTAVLQLRADVTPATPTVGREALMTIDVANRGGEAARNVRVRVILPPGLTCKQATPSGATITGQEVVFPAQTVGARGDEKFTLTLQPETRGGKQVTVRVEADSLGAEPLSKTVELAVRGEQ
jgi:uncharacterized repeat protein (TIGR01451 family)